MKKLMLDLNALAVQSFATDDEAVPVFGTVHGQQKGKTGQHADCSAADGATSSACTDDCVTKYTEVALNCPSSRGCPTGQGCGSAVDACPSSLGCTQFKCPVER